jgi:hypothetical protein
VVSEIVELRNSDSLSYLPSSGQSLHVFLGLDSSFLFIAGYIQMYEFTTICLFIPLMKNMLFAPDFDSYK